MHSIDFFVSRNFVASATQVARSQRGAEVDEIIAGWTRQHTKEEAMTLFGAADVPAGAVFDTLELMNDPSFAERSIMQTIDHPSTGKVNLAGRGEPLRIRGRPPVRSSQSELLAGQLSADYAAGANYCVNGRPRRRAY